MSFCMDDCHGSLAGWGPGSLVRRPGQGGERAVRLSFRLYRRKFTHNSFGRWFRMHKSIRGASGSRQEVLVY
jgi:hypothetical protein